MDSNSAAPPSSPATIDQTGSFVVGDQVVVLGDDESLHDALVRGGRVVDAPCGGGGRCGRCRIRVTPAAAASETPHESISAVDSTTGVRLACRVRRLEQAATVHLLDDVDALVATTNIEASPSVQVSSGRLGLAIDVGTTTLVATLVDLETHRPVAHASTLNPQRRFGHDVITRIQHGSTERGLADLSSCVRTAVNALARAFIRRGGFDPSRIEGVVLGGNPTMLQLAAAIDPAPLGQAPFTATFRGGECSPTQFGLASVPAASVYVPPVIDAFLGADLTAGLVAVAERILSVRAALYIDLGTNGEVVLHHDGRWWSTSTAAGPAFEAMGLSHGMRAADGAITRVRAGPDDIEIDVLGGGTAQGLCGSGVVDLVSTLLQFGVIDPTGRIAQPESTVGTPPRVAARLERNEGRSRFRVATNVRLTQEDVRHLQLAKGAIRAAIEVLLERARLDAVDCLIVAGGFGAQLDIRSAMRIGLLPPQTAHDVCYVGNASLSGCERLLRDAAARARIESLSNRIESVELAAERSYSDRFTHHLGFESGALS